jgi:hypothetical protein
LKGVAIFISDKADFKTKLEEKKEITILNLYPPNISVPTLLNIKVQINSNTAIVGDFSTLLT